MRTRIFHPVADRRTRRRHRVGTAALVTVMAGAVVALTPERFRLSTTPYVLHAVSFRGPLAVASSVAGLISLLTAPSRCGGRPWRRMALAGTLLSTGIGHAGILWCRGWATPPVPGRADLVVVSLNTLAGAATPRQVATLVAAELSGAEAAMVSLPETSAVQAQECAELLATAGHPFQVFSTSAGPRASDSISLLVSHQMGTYRQQLPSPKMLLGAVLAVPETGEGPTLAAVHPGAPVPGVGYCRWASDVTTAVDLCRRHTDSVVAGDFNTTIDHAMMYDLTPCINAAVAAGRGAEGTWPAHFPAPLAAPIDHVLVNGGYSVLGTRTERVGASDHRAVIARLRRVL
jgi:endonuclease/exonuclease/phosphatase (EEP) superfamily protein YafD